MENLGEYLKNMRVQKGISIDEISEITRITRKYLIALENNDMQSLPVPAYTRGFIKLYLKALDIPSDEAIRMYEGNIKKALDVEEDSKKDSKSIYRRKMILNIGWTAIILIILSIPLYIFYIKKPPYEYGMRSRNVQESGKIDLKPDNKTEVINPVPSEPERISRDENILKAKVIELTWIKIEMSDGKSIQELLQAGQVREWRSKDKFNITIGNAGGINLELNNVSLGMLGARGQVIRNLILPK